MFPPLMLKTRTGFLFMPAAPMALITAAVSPANATETTRENRLLKNLRNLQGALDEHEDFFITHSFVPLVASRCTDL